MVAAHMDEIGLCVVKITEEGFLKVKKVGGVSASLSFMNELFSAMVLWEQLRLMQNQKNSKAVI